MKMTMMRAAAIAVWMGGLATLTGCNTIAGFGQDISGGANRVAGWFGG